MQTKFKRILLTFATLLFCAAPLGLRAAVINYDMVFEDQSGAAIGSGALSYDNALPEYLYVDDRDRQCSPGEFFCEYFATWTPLTSLTAQIQGVDIFAYGSNTQLWVEGHFSYHGRYEIGGYVPGVWFIGDIYFGLSQFQAAPPPQGASEFTTDFFLGSVDLPDFWTSGQLTYTQVVVPLPASGVLLGLLSLCFFALSRRRPKGPSLLPTG